MKGRACLFIIIVSLALFAINSVPSIAAQLAYKNADFKLSDPIRIANPRFGTMADNANNASAAKSGVKQAAQAKLAPKAPTSLKVTTGNAPAKTPWQIRLLRLFAGFLAGIAVLMIYRLHRSGRLWA